MREWHVCLIWSCWERSANHIVRQLWWERLVNKLCQRHKPNVYTENSIERIFCVDRCFCKCWLPWWKAHLDWTLPHQKFRHPAIFPHKLFIFFPGAGENCILRNWAFVKCLEKSSHKSMMRWMRNVGHQENSRGMLFSSNIVYFCLVGLNHSFFFHYMKKGNIYAVWV